MKQLYTLSLVLALFLVSCEEPTISSHDINDDTYGSSIIKIPYLALSKIASSQIKYTFALTINGSNMNSMNFKWTLDGSGAIFHIKRIPAGHSRLFEGMLYGTDGSTYEGRAYADIYGGKTAHITLVLRRTGSANVDVIIEEFPNDNTFVGCWEIKGRVNEQTMDNYNLNILRNKQGRFHGYVKEKEKIIGKFSGTESNGQIDAHFSIPPLLIEELQLKAKISSTGKSFKGTISSISDSLVHGYMAGRSIDCDTVTPPPPPPPAKEKVVIFDSQGADQDAKPNKLLVTPPATTLKKLPIPPVKAGYTFAGWYTEVNGIRVLFNEQFNVTDNMTVYASWVVNKNASSFVVWAEGAGCDRELQFRALDKDLNLIGNSAVAVKKGVGADFFVVISYDGEWIAFSRTNDRYTWKYGECDYHLYDSLDIYVAKIGNGKNLPAKAIKVDHGYWPSWGMDINAKDPSKPKLLYYTRYDDQTIRKAVINTDGMIASKDVLHATCPRKVQGSASHTQGSPDGKFILYRPGKMKVYSVELNKDISENLGGQHPCWGPRSKYFIRSKNGVFYNTGTSVIKLGAAGVGAYWQGISNDAYFDEGKLWVIARIGGRTQNDGGIVEFKEVDISNGGWKVGKATKVSENGSSCDIHIAQP